MHACMQQHTFSSSYFSSLVFPLGNSTMAIRVAAILPLGIIFFVSGLFINLLQAICFVLIWPLSKNTFRRINKVLGEMILLELVWVVDWWAGVKMLLYTDSETFHLVGKEHALVISNHRSDIDWLVGYVLSQRLGCLGSTLGVMKKSLKFLPVLGWSSWFSEYLFLERRWAKDENTLKFGLSQLKDYPLPFWLALYVEGTRFTEKKLLAAQAYAASNGLPIPRNVLVPHTKGFVSAVRYMRSYVPAIYDVTLAIPENSPPPTMLRLISGQPSVLHCHVKRYEMKELPENDADVAQWCRDLFIAKDAFLDKHRAENTFSPQELQDTSRTIKPLLLVSGWAGVLILGIVKLLHRSWVLSSWKGIGFSAFGFAFVAFIMLVMVRFSQSEHSTPMKVVSVKSKNGEKPSEITRDKQQ